MRAGWYISGVGHIALILFLLFGGLFSEDRIPEFQVAQVSLISEADLAALTPPGAAPDIASAAPRVAAPTQDAPPDTPVPDVAPDTAAAPAAPEPASQVEPKVSAIAPLPGAIVDDKAPPIPLPPTEIDGTAPVPDAVAAPAPRVAPLPQIAPPPQAETAPQVVEETAPVPDAPPEKKPMPDKAAAPPQASDRIVTEAEKTKTYAPASSMRPRSRPPEPVKVAAKPTESSPQKPAPDKPTPPQAPATDLAAEAIAAAVAEANQAPAPAPAGPPLTGGEKEAFTLAVGNCWIVDPGAQSAGVKVTVGFSLSKDGRVYGDVRLVGAEGGDAGSQRAAFDAARRAVLRCGAKGFPLPVEKYAQWRDIEMTFNPEGMQLR